MVLTSKRFSVASPKVMAESAATPNVRIERTNCSFDFCGHRLFARDHKPLTKMEQKGGLIYQESDMIKSSTIGITSENYRKTNGKSCATIGRVKK